MFVLCYTDEGDRRERVSGQLSDRSCRGAGGRGDRGARRVRRPPDCTSSSPSPIAPPRDASSLYFLLVDSGVSFRSVSGNRPSAVIIISTGIVNSDPLMGMG